MCPSRSIAHTRNLEASEAGESCITELGGKSAKSSFSFNHSRSEWEATEKERERERSGFAAEQHRSDDKATAIVRKEQKLATVSAPRGNLRKFWEMSFALARFYQPRPDKTSPLYLHLLITE